LGVDQEIRFVEAAGTRVGAAIVGEGPPLVLAYWWIGDVEAQWEVESFRAFLGELARDRTVIRYDRPGSGLSGPASAADDLAADTTVLGDVVAKLGGGRAAVLGASCGGCGAIALAATKPELVERLILYGAYADGGAITTPAVQQSLEGLVRAHWGLGAMALVDVFMPEADARAREEFARFERRVATADKVADSLRLVYRLDASAYVDQVRVPTLVVHRTGDRAIPIALGRELAARIPAARFVPLAGRNHFPWTGDTASVLRAMRAFLGAPAAETTVDGPLSTREREVLGLIAAGLSDADIADQLVLSRHTVHRHVANVRRKLRQPSRAAAVAEASRLGLI
jgi:pimeloyl-ACP methyl ester carboxylesterase/DNA-binding CsgD family transcriptional regulator